MIVCSCNIITESEIEEVITDFLDEEPWQLITAGMVYHAMQKRGKCCNCFPRVIDIIVRVTTTYHSRLESSEADIVPFLEKIKEEHARHQRVRMMRSEGQGVEAA